MTRYRPVATRCRQTALPMNPAPPVTRAVSSVSLIGKFVDPPAEIGGIGGVAELCGAGEHLVGGHVTLVERDLLEAHDLEALAVLDGADERRRLLKHLVGPGIEPRKAAAEALDAQVPAIEIGLVDVGDFELAPARRSDGRGDIEHVIVVIIEAGDRPVGLRPGRFLLERNGAAGALLER